MQVGDAHLHALEPQHAGRGTFQCVNEIDRFAGGNRRVLVGAAVEHVGRGWQSVFNEGIRDADQPVVTDANAHLERHAGPEHRRLSPALENQTADAQPRNRPIRASVKLEPLPDKPHQQRNGQNRRHCGVIGNPERPHREDEERYNQEPPAAGGEHKRPEYRGQRSRGHRTQANPARKGGGCRAQHITRRFPALSTGLHPVRWRRVSRSAHHPPPLRAGFASGCSRADTRAMTGTARQIHTVSNTVTASRISRTTSATCLPSISASGRRMSRWPSTP